MEPRRSPVGEWLQEARLKPGNWLAITVPEVALDTSGFKSPELWGCELSVSMEATRTTDVVDEVLKTTDGEGAHGVFVTAGSPSAYKSAPNMLRIGAKIMCIGLPPAGSTIAGADLAEFVLRNISITGSIVGGMLATKRCLEMAQRGLVKPIYETFSINQLPEAVDKHPQGQIEQV
ncbi:hypothetical protein PISL3812_04020 [Talaromyces islandicus]|uniref:Alcohol dehydrogenase-like C-terminal domain-containing protein n=1 Tax=Talaromyces islandicus TaxID=28573 RepID=A0A0U1LUD5_TALIS|nr:hypothetical protein PISL3812_04020 [Talaromyces islandicus]